MNLKKILFITIVCLTAISAMGQTRFDAKEINATAEAFNDAKANTKRWAENIVKQGHLDKDSNICYTFNIPASDSLYIASIYDCIRMFADQRRAERQIDYTASSAEHVVIKTVEPKILYSDGNMAFAMSIDAYGSMTIDIMPCKLVITLTVDRYVNTAPFGRKVEPSYGAIWLPVKGVAPLTDNGNNKVWSKAFINANAECINLANTFVSILNTNYIRPEYY